MSAMFFRRGDRGPAVAEIRARLARLGLLEGSQHVRGDQQLRSLMFSSDPLEDDADAPGPSQWETTALVSAVFDDEVDQAVRQFQRGRGITVDGIVGPETFRRLEEARWQLGDRVLSYQPGHLYSGDDVLQLQRQLNRMGFDSGKEDAHFGPLTDRALREFQRNVGLAVDGVAGPLTMRALGRLHRTVGQQSAHTARERYALPKLQTGIAGKTVMIDVSPGSLDPGPEMSGVEALAIAGAIAKQAARQLAAAGAVVVRPESLDAVGRPLDELVRAETCNDSDADLVISLHVDYGDETSPAFAVYFYGRSSSVFSAAGRAAAEALSDSFIEGAGATHCDVDARTWDILRATRMPSVRVCFGQIGDPTVRDRLPQAPFQERVAEAIVAGLTEFFSPIEAEQSEV